MALLCASQLFAQNNQPMTIVIDPGHGGYDPGAVATLNGKQYRECDIALSIALKAGSMIEKNMPQVKVIYTRNSDKHLSTNKTRDLQARVDIANKADAGLFLSIHCNAAKATSASGAVTLIMGESSAKRIQQNADVIEDAYRDDLVDMSDAATAAAVRAYIKTVQFTLLQNSSTFANLLQKYHKNAVGHGNRRSLVYGQPLWVLCYTQMPGVLTEIGFMSNKHDLQIMATEDGQQKIAKAIYDGFCEYYKIYFGGEPQPIEEPEQVEVKTDVKAEEPKSQPAESEAPQQEVAKEEEATDVGYTIQLCASKTKIATNSSEFKSYRGRVREFVTDGTFCYKYCTGIFASKEEADNSLKEVRKLFKNAYVVGFDGNKLVSHSVVAGKLKTK
ncbi:MAG: N-acetylmuramoyl-L-alanine amidase [Rikenellaceae bacterium]|nr:N-acetylmuramoyl-L-alanine amidase [Rikenellaceae bacterium]